MSITLIQDSSTPMQFDKPFFFPDMQLAHQYCIGEGIELGAAAHNTFNLPGSVNVAPFSDDPSNYDHEDFLFFRNSQLALCGHYAKVDIVGEAHSIPVDNASQDYIISSHVVEHVPNLIAAFIEWNRVLKPGGIIFMIFPKHDAFPLDANRPITPLNHFIEDYYTHQTLETHGFEGGHGLRGHYHVFTLDSMLELIQWCNANLSLSWKVEAVEETDSKAGNGHTVVCRYVPSETNLPAELPPLSTPRSRTTLSFVKMRTAQLLHASYHIVRDQGIGVFIRRVMRWLGGERRYFRR